MSAFIALYTAAPRVFVCILQTKKKHAENTISGTDVRTQFTHTVVNLPKFRLVLG